MVEEKEDLNETLVSVLAWQFAISKQQTMRYASLSNACLVSAARYLPHRVWTWSLESVIICNTGLRQSRRDQVQDWMMLSRSTGAGP